MKIDIDWGLRRPAVLRPISTTQAQAQKLYRIYLRPIAEWERAVREEILLEYRATLDQMTRDSPADIETIIERTDNGIVSNILGFWRGLVQEWIAEISIWHLRRFSANLRYATDIDMSTIIPGLEGPETIEAALNRNVNLIRSVSDQTRERIADIVFRGLTGRVPVDQIAREIRDAVGLSKKRARRIASDQTVKLSAALDRQRMQAVGIEEFEWRHSGKMHPREWHVARDGKRFRFDDPALRGDLPGDQPFCGCKAMGILD